MSQSGCTRVPDNGYHVVPTGGFFADPKYDFYVNNAVVSGSIATSSSAIIAEAGSAIASGSAPVYNSAALNALLTNIATGTSTPGIVGATNVTASVYDSNSRLLVLASSPTNTLGSTTVDPVIGFLQNFTIAPDQSGSVGGIPREVWRWHSKIGTGSQYLILQGYPTPDPLFTPCDLNPADDLGCPDDDSDDSDESDCEGGAGYLSALFPSCSTAKTWNLLSK